MNDATLIDDGMPEQVLAHVTPAAAVMKAATSGDVEHVRWWCPGCSQNHLVPINGPLSWDMTGTFEAPTLFPSVLVNGIRGISTEEWNRANPRCHSYIRGGRIEFLADCEHELAGQTVPMGPVR